MRLENRWSLRERLTNLGLGDARGRGRGDDLRARVRERWAKLETKLEQTFGRSFGRRSRRSEAAEGAEWRGDRREPAPRHVPHFSEPGVWGRVTDLFASRASHEPKRPDARILEEIRERLSYHPYVDASDVEVSVEEGAVTLAGFVDDRDDRRRVGDVAADVVGVRSVQNVLDVRRAEPAGRAPRSERGEAPAPSRPN